MKQTQPNQRVQASQKKKSARFHIGFDVLVPLIQQETNRLHKFRTKKIPKATPSSTRHCPLKQQTDAIVHGNNKWRLLRSHQVPLVN